MRTLTLFLLALTGAVLAGCDASDLAVFFPSQTEATTAEPVNQELVDYGVQVYRSQYCGTCHTLEAANTRGTFGPEHNGIATIAEARLRDGTYVGEAETLEDYFYETLLDPRVYIVPGFEITSHPMPAYTHLPLEDVDALVYMLVQQR